MARVTVEDCLKKINNRFDLALVAAKRAHQINAGGASLVDKRNDKPAVIALREIAEGLTDTSILSGGANANFTTSGVDMAEVEAELSETALDTKADELSEVKEENI